MTARRGWIVLALAALIPAALLIVRISHPDGPPAKAVKPTAERSQPAPAPRPTLATPAEAPLAGAPLPGSLDGTEADGAVTADAGGHLVISLELRRLFDHFLAATGEEPIATMRARIIAALKARLPATATAEAIEILDRYLAYREAARGLAPKASDTAGLAQLHELRARSFTPAVNQAFFADEEAAISAALARRDVLADPTLGDAERARRIAELDARVPAQVREGRAAALVPLEEMQREAELRAAGASPAQITAARTAAFGSDGAARLAELDRAHAAWDARLQAFRAARAQLLADPRLDDAARQARTQALLEQSFTPPERLRVQTIEHLPAP